MSTEWLLGALVGLIMGLTGAGGGVLAVPLLVFVSGMAVSDAAPVGLVAVGLAAAVGAALGLRRRVVRYRAALLMGITGAALAPLGLWLGGRIDERWLSGLFAGVLLWAAWRAVRGHETAATSQDYPCKLRDDTGRFRWDARCARALAGTGAVAGTLSGLLGVGGGFIIVPALDRYSRLDRRSIIATSLAVIALVSAAAVTGAALGGRIELRMAAPFAAAAVLGLMAGRVLSRRLPERALRLAFAAMTAAVAVGMGYKAIG